MADIKFSCAQCGQHISCDEQWSGQQIQCPICQNNLVVPHIHPPPAAAAPAATPQAPEPPAPSRPKLAQGLPQAARSAPPGTSPQRQRVVRSPKTGNPPLRFAIIAVVLGLVVWAGFVYVPGLLNQAQEMGTSLAPTPASGSAAGGAGPLGEVNGAMDISDTLGGSSPSRPRAGAARPPAVAPPPATPATNPAAKPITWRVR